MKENVLVYRGREILTDAVTGEYVMVEVPSDKIVCKYTERISAAEVAPDFMAPDGTAFKIIREYFATHDDEASSLVARMKGLLNWHMSTKFCCSCGAALKEADEETALLCPSCGMVHYPRVEPCVITIVEKGDEILLLRHKQRNQDLWCCLAGFIEVGESLEHGLQREIREETGIEVENIRYMGSQSWPFPDQLMVAFYATYKSGDLKIQENEISEARWFPKSEIPVSPQPGSISWKLIHYAF